MIILTAWRLRKLISGATKKDIIFGAERDDERCETTQKTTVDLWYLKDKIFTFTETKTYLQDLYVSPTVAVDLVLM